MTEITIKGADTIIWHDKLYPIPDKYRSGFRFNRSNRSKTKKQLLHVVVDGTSIYTFIPRNHFRKVVIGNQDHIQISKVWYDQNKSTFKHKEQKEHTITLDRFIKTSKEGN